MSEPDTGMPAPASPEPQPISQDVLLHLIGLGEDIMQALGHLAAVVPAASPVGRFVRQMEGRLEALRAMLVEPAAGWTE